jgi:peptidoglycan/LPS O-acetylase OafA/YrhL
MMPRDTINYRSDIDGLRAIAILSVLICHAFPNFLPGGFIGVDIFFVISGFLITKNINKEIDQNEFSLIHFYDRRIRRLFPALAFVLISVFTLGYLILLKEELQQLSKYIAAGSGFISNFILWKDAGYFDSSSNYKPLLHLWSLGIEEQFYICWPLVMIFFSKRGILKPIIIFLVLCSLIFCEFTLYEDKISAFYSPISRIWELLLGGAISLDYNISFLKKRFNNYYSLTGLALIIFSLVLFNSDTPLPGILTIIPTTGTALIILSDKKNIINNILSKKNLVWFGIISYPLYLWHWPLLSFARIIYPIEPPWWIMASLSLVSVMLAWMTHIFIEKKIRFSPKRFTSVKLLLCMTCIGFFAISIYFFQDILMGDTFDKNQGHQTRLNWDYARKDQCDGVIAFNKDIDYCFYPTIKPSIALIGDSHSNHFFPGLQDTFSKKGIGLLHLGMNGCLTFWDLESKGLKQPNRCQPGVNSLLTYLLNNKDIKKIIIATRTSAYLKKELWELKIKEVTYPNLVAIKKSLEKTLILFKRKGKEIIWIHNVPELNFNIKSCLPERPSYLKTHLFCSRSKKEAFNEIISSRETIEEIMRKNKDVKTIDPFSILCDQNNCFAKVENKILYRDKDHLSFEGSLFIAPKIIKEISLTH